MPRNVLATTLLLVGVSAAQADDNRLTFEGAMKVTNESLQCNGLFSASHNERVRYYPQFEPYTPNSALVRFGKGETELIQRFGNGQFGGQGVYYEQFRISGGEFSQFPEIEGPAQTFDFTQTPGTVAPTTVFVTLQGTFMNYAGIQDCTVTVRGTFVRVDGEIPPPVY
ncbi:MAG TPA: hypothetical protein VFK79_17160 [Xanthobacteraceae bacterium]|nr:hypothetical protein [Xanthobacteraceae bacterium]